ncbi:MAG TPA: hypothetical protein DCY79_00980 [Planctomycetaceae bacterium]|nr:hypothetical protein [Planctomycetaceae bacterium]
MNKDYKDQILDLCLDETLGGITPPDVADRVAAAFSQGTTPVAANGSQPRRRRVEDMLPPAAFDGTSPNGAASSASASSAAHSDAHPPIQHNRRTSRKSRRSQSRPWTQVSLALTLLAVACGVSYAFYQLAKSSPSESDLAKQQTTSPDGSSTPAAIPKPDQDQPRRPRPAQQTQRAPEKQRPTVSPSDTQPSPVPPRQPGNTQPPLHKPAFATAPAELPTPLSDHEVVARIDSALANAWSAAGIDVAPDAEDNQWCVRAYTRLIGRSPDAAELEQFTSNRDTNKRAQLVDQLVSQPEFAAHWGDLLGDVLLGANANPRTNRDALKTLLTEALADDTPYDDLTLALLTASGSNQAQQEDYNPATNYLLAHAGRDTLEATAQVSRHFLGQRTRCVQCHDSMVDGNAWQQQRFWGLDSFLRQMVVQSGSGAGGAAIVDRDFRGEGKTPEEAEVYFSKMNGVLEVAFPRFIDGTEINASGFVADVNRREAFAKLLVASTAFREATANRVWAELLGTGFTTPIDDMGPHNPPVHPELLKELGEQLAAHDFQLKAFVAWVAKSKAFQLQEATAPTGDHAGQMFAAYTPPQDSGLTLEKSLALFAKARGGSQLTEQDQQQIGRLVSPNTPSTGGTNLQIIDTDMEFLSELGPMQATIADEAFDSVTRRVVYGSMSPQQKVEHLFQYRLGRQPTRRELQHASELLGDEDSDSGFRVLSWTLRNRPESR